MEKTLITELEELALNAWAAPQTLLFDGWVLRYADGYTRRANCVNPIYPSSQEIKGKISICEHFYRNRGLPVIFKMTEAVQPVQLDEELQTRGYTRDGETSVQTVGLSTVNLDGASEAEFSEEFSDSWLENYCRMNAVPEKHHPALRKILKNILPDHCFATLRAGGLAVSCGMGVRQGDYVGLFDIVTDSTARNRGFGRRLVEDILRWGRRKGAKKGYLQVMMGNAPALHLYGKLGFSNQYHYWYRVKV